MPKEPQHAAPEDLIPGGRYPIAIASGKGGVGKTTMSVNVAAALAARGAAVGLLDADLYGPNVPLMLGITAAPSAEADTLRPVERYGIRVMSMAFFLQGDQPVIWRGPMLHNALRQFLGSVEWGALDYLIIDLPPGTGDVQITLAQSIPLAGGVLVTTPQLVAQLDVAKACQMFRRVEVPVLGVVENMSGFACPHCHQRTDIFGSDGGRRLAERLGVPYLGAVPIVGDVARAGDDGRPGVLTDLASAWSQAVLSVVDRLAGQLDDLSRPAARHATRS